MPVRKLLLLPTLALALAAPGPASAQSAPAGCPGLLGPETCPYTATAQIGQRTGGVLRFPQAVAVAPDGAIVVGDQGTHAVSVFNPDGSFRGEIGSPGAKPGQLSAVGAVAVAGDGSVLVADGANRIDRFGADGALLASWGQTGSAVGDFRFGGGRGNDAGAGGGLAVGGDFVYVADSGNDRIQRFDLSGGRGAGIVAPGQLAHPKGLAVRGNRLFVADDQNHRVVVMDTGGRTLTTIGTGNGPLAGQLNYPYGVATDAQGRVFVADNLNQRIVRYSDGPAYPYKGRWGSYGTGPGQLAYPRAVAVDATGNVLVANTGNDRVDVYDRGGTFVRSFGASGRANGQFNTPSGVAADAAGVRAVTDAVNGRVQLFGSDGAFLTSWGSPAPGPTILPRPVAAAFSPAGDLFVLDQRRARIVVFSRATGAPVRTIGSQGSGPGQMLDPSAMVSDAQGRLYVADTGNERIVRFTAGGESLGAITATGRGRGIAVSPDGQTLYVVDGDALITRYDAGGQDLQVFGGRGNTLGKLDAPGQMAVDAAGDLWVADTGNSRVQHFGPEGERLASLGSRGTGPGQFIHPTGVAIDCNGLLTVTDTDNNRVQSFALAAPALTGCSPLAALGTPPAVKLPTLPVPEGPQVTLKVLRTTGLFGARTLPIRVGCDTACTVTTSVTVSQRGRPAKGKRAASVVLAGLKAEVKAGESTLLRPTLTLAQVRTLRRALRTSRALSATLQVTASAPVGAPTVVSQTVAGTG